MLAEKYSTTETKVCEIVEYTRVFLSSLIVAGINSGIGNV